MQLQVLPAQHGGIDALDVLQINEHVVQRQMRCDFGLHVMRSPTDIPPSRKLRVNATSFADLFYRLFLFMPYLSPLICRLKFLVKNGFVTIGVALSPVAQSLNSRPDS